MSVCGFSENTVESMFKSIDKDGSGSVSLKELLAWYSEHEPERYTDKDVVTSSALDLASWISQTMTKTTELKQM